MQRSVKGLIPVVSGHLFATAAAVLVVAAVRLPAQEGSCWRRIQAANQVKATADSGTAVGDSARIRARRCIDSTDASFRDRAIGRASAEMARLMPLSLTIPENHDEGRLPDGTGLLGPMVHIFGSPFMGGFTRRAQIVEHGQPGVLAAVVVVQLRGGETIPTSYLNLGLHDGMSCLWLSLANVAPSTNYRVAVTHAVGASPTSGGTCERTAPVVANLTVADVAEAGFPYAEQYPATARLDFDNSGRVTFGFKCAKAWCEAGTTDATVRVSWARGIAPSPTTPAQRRIKGWHDEQVFAEEFVTGLGQTRWRAATVRGSIVPDENIGDRDRAYFVANAGRWVRVAELDIVGPLTPASKYYAWGLRSGRNYLGMRYVAGRDTLEVGVFANPLPATPSSAPSPRGIWKVRERMMHFDVPVPPTARFRFTVADDGVWIPCGVACCRADGDDY